MHTGLSRVTVMIIGGNVTGIIIGQHIDSIYYRNTEDHLIFKPTRTQSLVEKIHTIYI